MQTHPEISITFRRMGDGSIAVMCVARKSKDKDLSLRAQVIAEALKHLMPHVVQAAEEEIAADAKNKQPEVMH
jgi:hypothetical protein